MKIFIWLLIVGISSCVSKKSEQEIKEVDNAATRYVEDLQGDLQGARTVRDKHNEAVKDREAIYQGIGD